LNPISTAPASPAPAATEQAADALFDAVYQRLKAMAGRQLSRSAQDTLNTTALVHELYLRIGEQRDLAFEHPQQFFAYAARAMRHLLVDRARARLRQRAGGEWSRTTLTAGDSRLSIDSAEQALALDAALQRLQETDARAAQVLEWHHFAGLSIPQIAESIGVAASTVDRDLRFARAFLKKHVDP
jgi:RNA polymerase sigma factor (TIGR02999 family)